MNNKTTLGDVEIPRWDVAIESLIAEEYYKNKTGLRVDDFKRLSTEHTIRFDDIMDTVFKLCIHGEWRYRDEKGKDVAITQKTVNELYVNARLHEKDVRELKGSWAPMV